MQAFVDKEWTIHSVIKWVFLLVTPVLFAGQVGEVESHDPFLRESTATNISFGSALDALYSVEGTLRTVINPNVFNISAKTTADIIASTDNPSISSGNEVSLSNIPDVFAAPEVRGDVSSDTVFSPVDSSEIASSSSSIFSSGRTVGEQDNIFPRMVGDALFDNLERAREAKKNEKPVPPIVKSDDPFVNTLELGSTSSSSNFTANPSPANRSDLGIKDSDDKKKLEKKKLEDSEKKKLEEAVSKMVAPYNEEQIETVAKLMEPSSGNPSTEVSKKATEMQDPNNLTRRAQESQARNELERVLALREGRPAQTIVEEANDAALRRHDLIDGIPIEYLRRERGH